MKKGLIAALFAVSGALAIGTTALAQEKQITLPAAGLTPNSPFYILDRLGENLRQFFTFDPAAKAKLQIEFAGERIAEIKLLIETDPDAKGAEIARSLLVANVAYAAEIVAQEKAAGKDVAALAKDLDDEFDAREQLLVETFLEAKQKLLAERKEIKDTLLKAAQAAGDTARIAELTGQLGDIQSQIDNLTDKKNEIKSDVRVEKEKIEQEMKREEQREDAIEQERHDQAEQEQEEQIEAEEAPELEESEEPAEAPEAKESEEGEADDTDEVNLQDAGHEDEETSSQTQATSTEQGD